METIFITNEGKELNRTRCEIYTRVMGYFRPVTSFNIGKKAEFYSRTYFKGECANKIFNKEYKN